MLGTQGRAGGEEHGGPKPKGVVMKVFATKVTAKNLLKLLSEGNDEAHAIYFRGRDRLKLKHGAKRRNMYTGDWEFTAEEIFEAGKPNAR